MKYPAEVIRVIDGDTVELKIHLGFNLKIVEKIRLLNIDAHEMRGGTEVTKALGKSEKAFVTDTLNESLGIYVSVTEQDSFGRWLGNILYEREGEVHDLATSLKHYMEVNDVKV